VSGAFDDDPVFGAVAVLLQGEGRAGVDGEALDLEAEALIRKTKAAQARAEAWKQKALAQEAERDRLLGLLFSSPPQKT